MNFMQLRQQADTAKDANTQVCLVIPKRHLPKGDKVRMTSKASPLGWLATIRRSESKLAPFEAVAFFDPEDILAWLDKNEVWTRQERGMTW